MYRSLVALLVLPVLVQAGDKCFCQPYYMLQPATTYQQPYTYEEAEKVTVDVITRQLRLQPAKPPVQPGAAELAFQQQYAALLAVMPLTPRATVAPLRQFQFVHNVPVYKARQQVQRQQTQTATVTQTLWGVVQQNVVVQNGAVFLDVDPHLLKQLTPVPVIEK